MKHFRAEKCAQKYHKSTWLRQDIQVFAGPAQFAPFEYHHSTEEIGG